MRRSGGDLDLRGGFERDVDLDFLKIGLDTVGEAEQVPVDHDLLVSPMMSRKLMDQGGDASFSREGHDRARIVDENPLELEADLLACGVFVPALEELDESVEVLAEGTGERGDAGIIWHGHG